VFPKSAKETEIASIFYEFSSEEIHFEKALQKNNLIFECGSCGSCIAKDCNILMLMFKKTTSRSCSCFSKFTYFDFWKNDFFNFIKNCLVLSKKHKEF
jgi:hypothetical protein